MLDYYVNLFKVLADKSRLKILASLNKEPMYVELISKRIGVNVSTVSHHLKKLEEIGIVSSKKEQYYVVYYLQKDQIDCNIKEIINSISLEAKTEEEKEQEYYNKIIATFFNGKRLTQIPVQRKKRDVILKEIAKEFEIGKEYSEKEVNLIISEFHDDFCTLRREFIMNRLFTRDNGVYTRVK